MTYVKIEPKQKCSCSAIVLPVHFIGSGLTFNDVDFTVLPVMMLSSADSPTAATQSDKGTSTVTSKNRWYNMMNLNNKDNPIQISWL